MTLAEERRIYQLFIISLALKVGGAVLEIVSAVLIAVVDAKVLSGTVVRLAGEFLLAHPDDRIAEYFQHAAEHFSVDVKTFAVLYLASHGLIKLFLLIGLLRNVSWAYPASIVAFSAFIVYQLYRYTHTHAVMLIVLTVFDLIVVGLVWHEWRLRRAGKPIGRETATF